MRPVLVVAHRHVVGDRVAGHRIEGGRPGDAADGAADHERELGLVVGGRRLGRDHDRVPRRHERLGELREQHGVVRRVVHALVHVRAVVEAHADDLPRTRDDRPHPHLGERDLLVAHGRVREQLRRRARPARRRRAAGARRRRPRGRRTAGLRASSSRSAPGQPRAPSRRSRMSKSQVENGASSPRSASSALVVALEGPDERRLHRADRVVLEVRVVREEDLRDERLVASGGHLEVDVRRAPRMLADRLEVAADRPVGRHRVRLRDHGLELVGARLGARRSARGS